MYKVYAWFMGFPMLTPVTVTKELMKFGGEPPLYQSYAYLLLRDGDKDNLEINLENILGMFKNMIKKLTKYTSRRSSLHS